LRVFGRVDSEGFTRSEALTGKIVRVSLAVKPLLVKIVRVLLAVKPLLEK